MPAICYWCHTPGTSTISNHSGVKDSPFGCCFTCHVLACGYHAVRDNAACEFVCFDCDVNGLCQMAASSLGQGLKSNISQSYLNWVQYFNAYGELTYQAFKERRPGYKNWFEELERLKSIPFDYNTELAYKLNQLTNGLLLLLELAAYILYKMYGRNKIPAHYPQFVLDIIDEIIRKEKQSNNG